MFIFQLQTFLYDSLTHRIELIDIVLFLGISLKDVLKFSLGPISWSLANTDGSIYKSVKSKLLQAVEKEIPSLEEIPSNSTMIYDGMCVIQQLPNQLNTFGVVSDFVLRRITSNSAKEVMFIADQYLETSIKGGERERRATTGQIRITATRCDQPAPKQFKKYLAVGANKTELLEFLVKDWTHPRHVELIRGKCIYFTLKSEAYKIHLNDNQIQSISIPELCSSQEEADTKIFLAANYSNIHFPRQTVTIHTVDSDVAILACYYASILANRLYIKIGTGKNERILNVSDTPYEESFLRSLPGLHAFSGCDSTSAFHGISKIKWLTLVKSSQVYCDALCLLGESLDIEDAILCSIEQMVCSAYGFPNEENINEVRYMKCCGKKLPEPTRLPPTKDELKQHVLRSNYQAFIWKRALEGEPAIPDPDGYGWDLDDGHLSIHWMDNRPAPDEILELVVCECNRKKCGDNCQCSSFQIPCTDICKCKGECGNGSNNENVTHDVVLDTDDDDEDLSSSDYDSEKET